MLGISHIFFTPREPVTPKQNKTLIPFKKFINFGSLRSILRPLSLYKN